MNYVEEQASFEIPSQFPKPYVSSFEDEMTQTEAEAEATFKFMRKIGVISEKEVVVQSDTEKREDWCPQCKIKMEIYVEENRFCCPECGLLTNRDDPDAYILTSDDYLSYTLAEPKKTEFKPDKHFGEWFDHIMGRTAPPHVEDTLKAIRCYIMQNRICGSSPELLRNVLKRMGLSKYYKHISYLYLELTGITPPDIPRNFTSHAMNIFQRFIQTREMIRDQHPSWGKNNPSYSYLIYKIFNAILPQNDIENRRIFYFTHLPSQATLKKRDAEWDIIWKELNKPVG